MEDNNVYILDTDLCSTLSYQSRGLPSEEHNQTRDRNNRDVPLRIHGMQDSASTDQLVLSVQKKKFVLVTAVNPPELVQCSAKPKKDLKVSKTIVLSHNTIEPLNSLITLQSFHTMAQTYSKVKKVISQANNTRTVNAITSVRTCPQIQTLKNTIPIQFEENYVLLSNNTTERNILNESVRPNHSHNFKKRNRNSKTQLKAIPPKEFKQQLLDTSDIVSPIILLPHKNTIPDVFSWNLNTSLKLLEDKTSGILRKLYERNCITKSEPDEIDVKELNLMPYGWKRELDLSKIKRITRVKKNVKYLIPQTEVNMESMIDSSDKQIELEYENNIEFETNTPQYESQYILPDDESSSFDPKDMQQVTEYDQTVLDNENGTCFYFENVGDVHENEVIIIQEDNSIEYCQYGYI